jgi:DNA-binding NtrC family response regulator
VAHSGCILIIDDEPNLSRTLAYVLQRVCHIVATAINAKEALQYLHNDTIDLVFLDLKLPDVEEDPRHPQFIITVHDIGYRLIT